MDEEWQWDYIPTIIKKQDHVTIKNRCHPMCNCDDCRVREMLPQCLLNEVVSSSINWSSCFIKHQDLASLQYHTAKTDELSLTHTPVLSIFSNCGLHEYYINAAQGNPNNLRFITDTNHYIIIIRRQITKYLPLVLKR